RTQVRCAIDCANRGRLVNCWAKCRCETSSESPLTARWDRPCLSEIRNSLPRGSRYVRPTVGYDRSNPDKHNRQMVSIWVQDPCLRENRRCNTAWLAPRLSFPFQGL